MANDNMPEKLPGDDLPPFPPGGVPTDPEELKAWRAKFTQDIIGHPYDDWSSVPVHKGARRDGDRP